MDRMQNGWWRGGSVSTLTEYGMTLPAIQVGPTKPPEIFAATYAQPVECGPGSRSLRLSPRMRRKNKVVEQTKLTMPVMAVGGEKSFGALQAVIMRHVATNVQEEVVAGSGHWLMEERPAHSRDMPHDYGL